MSTRKLRSILVRAQYLLDQDMSANQHRVVAAIFDDTLELLAGMDNPSAIRQSTGSAGQADMFDGDEHDDTRRPADRADI